MTGRWYMNLSLTLVLTLVHSSPLTSLPLPSHPTQHRVDLLFIMRLGSTFKISCCLTEGFFLPPWWRDSWLAIWIHVGCWMYIFVYILYVYSICIYVSMHIYVSIKWRALCSIVQCLKITLVLNWRYPNKIKIESSSRQRLYSCSWTQTRTTRSMMLFRTILEVIGNGKTDPQLMFKAAVKLRDSVEVLWERTRISQSR